MKRFGPYIREVRWGKKLSLEVVAHSAGVSISYLSEIERSIKMAPPFSGNRYAGLGEALGLRAKYLMARAIIDREAVFFRRLIKKGQEKEAMDALEKLM